MSEVSAATSGVPRGGVALLLTDDDEVLGTVTRTLGHDGALGSVRRARTLDAARHALADADVAVVLADPRVADASAAQVAEWLRCVEEPALVVVPAGAEPDCLDAVTTDLAHHVLVPGAPWQLLAAAVSRTIEQRATATRFDTWGERLAVVRHEMASPLSTIEGFLEALLAHGDDVPAERRRDWLHAAYRNAGRLRRLVTELTAAEPGSGPPADTDVRLRALRPALERALRDLGPDAAEVRLEVPDDLRALVDVDHLTAIVGNLVDNAAKYGQPPIVLRASRSDEQVEVAVVDHGEGVPDAFVPRMFERYTRADEVSERHPGSGIGLARCAELADAMGGSMRYERASAGGAAFVLTLRTRDPARPALVDVAAEQDAAPQTQPERPVGAVPGRPVAGDLEVVREGLHTHTTVGLGYDGRVVEGRAIGAATSESSTRTVVRATLDAIESFLGGAARFDIEQVRIVGTAGDEHVTVTVAATTPGGFERLVGAALTGQDAQRAAMCATLDALNRRIGQLFV